MSASNYKLTLTATPVKLFSSSEDGGACRSFFADNNGLSNIRILVLGVHRMLQANELTPPTIDATAMAAGRTLEPGQQFTWGNTRGGFAGGQIIEVWGDCPGSTSTVTTDVVQR
jgi:hypothetical protein